MLTAERLRELIDYDPLTGLFRWIAPRRRAAVGWFAGTPHGSGYRVICVDGTNYRAHRLAWLFVKGIWPRRTIDHLNRSRDDNRFDNLRDVSLRVNVHNRVGGLRGVERRERDGRVRWRVRIGHFGRLVTVGTFLTEAEAVAAAHEARELMQVGYNPRTSPKTSIGPNHRA